MSGATDFQSILTSLSAAGSVAKMLISADKTFDKTELKLKLADLMVAFGRRSSTGRGNASAYISPSG